VKPRLSKSAIQLREQIDDAYADRDRTSDGWIGDTRHAARKSDHNPDVQGWVRAIDVDRDLNGKGRKPDVMPDLVDQIRLLAKSGDKRISYIIFDGRSHHLRRLGLGVLMMGSISIIITHISALLSGAITIIRSSISR